MDFAAVEFWGMERIFEMPSATSISQLCCAGRAEGNSRALDAGHSRQVWLCTTEVVTQLAALVCCL